MSIWIVDAELKLHIQHLTNGKTGIFLDILGISNFVKLGLFAPCSNSNTK